MCGIVGYVGSSKVAPILLKGLRSLEYRGYDSAGVAVQTAAGIEVVRAAGKLDHLEQALAAKPVDGTVGIGHTRWATHGVPNNVNAHPHVDCHNQIALIHNGVIENYAAIKTELESRGHIFKSATDTEVLVHLIEEFYKQNKKLDVAVRCALKEVIGTYGIIVLSVFEPDTLIVARKGSPLVIGYGDGEVVIASDASALVELTRRVTYLEDGEVAVVTANEVVIKTLGDIEITKVVEELTFDLEQIEKLEQLRFLEHGIKMKIVVTEYDSLSVDTPKDLEIARRYYDKHLKK